MPWIIDYPLVLDVMRDQGLQCRYFNSGAFAFPPPVRVREIEWQAPSAELATRVVRAWRAASPGAAWLMPMSHWQHAFGQPGGERLAAAIESAGVDPGQLTHRPNASAIEFADTDADAGALERLIERLLTPPQASDYTIAFPRRPVLCELAGPTGASARAGWRVAEDEIVRKITEAVAAAGD